MITKRNANRFRSCSGRLVEAWWNNRKKIWIVGMQGTSDWDTCKDRKAAIKRIEELKQK